MLLLFIPLTLFPVCLSVDLYLLHMEMWQNAELFYHFRPRAFVTLSETRVNERFAFAVLILHSGFSSCRVGEEDLPYPSCFYVPSLEGSGGVSFHDNGDMYFRAREGENLACTQEMKYEY